MEETGTLLIAHIPQEEEVEELEVRTARVQMGPHPGMAEAEDQTGVDLEALLEIPEVMAQRGQIRPQVSRLARGAEEEVPLPVLLETELAEATMEGEAEEDTAEEVPGGRVLLS